MTRDEALLKLIAAEPDTAASFILATGWETDETLRTLDRLVRSGDVLRVPGSNGRESESSYRAKVSPW